MRRLRTLAAALVLAAAAAPAALAGDPRPAPTWDGAPDAADRAAACAAPCWQYAVTLPLWVPSISGTLASGDTEVETRRGARGFGGFFEKLVPDATTSLEFAFMGRFEAARGPWHLYADGFYVALDETVDWTIRDEDTTGQLEAYVLRAFVAWQPTWALGCGPCAPVLAAGPLVGARGFSVDVHVDPVDGDGLDRGDAWVDPIVGLKADLTFGNGAVLSALADVGTSFDGAHTSWSLALELAWPLDRRGRWFARAGWSMLDIEFEVGTGDRARGIDLHLTGPSVGFTYRF